MSKVKIEGNASGTGTFTIAAPNSNTDRTLTLPDEAGTVLTSASDLPAANLTGTLPAIDGSNLTNLPSSSGPVFMAELSSSQSLPHNTVTKVQFSSEVIDTDGCYDPTTNYRFTPTTAGYYRIGFVGNIFQSSGTKWAGVFMLYKNGTRILRVSDNQVDSSGEVSFNGSTIVEANGTTDYFEIYAYQYDYTSASSMTLDSNDYFSFDGNFLRGL